MNTHAFGTPEWVRAFVARGGRALSVRQPWAWLIVWAGKDIENRRWNCSYRGPLLIHAAKGCTQDEYLDGVHYATRVVGKQHFAHMDIPAWADMPRGCLVGVATVADCTRRPNGSPWFEGPYGIVLERVMPFRMPIPCKGALGLFRPVIDGGEV